jgi:hypothetical protein
MAQEDTIPETPPPPSEPQEPVAEPTTPPPAPKKLNYGDPPLHRWGGMTISVAAWDPSLVGANEEIATTYQFGIGSPIVEGSTPTIRETAVGIYHLPKDLGSIGMSYDSMNQDDSYSHLSPGNFIYGETRGYPLNLGAFDDGFSDGVTAHLVRKTRDFRLWFSQTAFESPRAKGTWAVGYRQLTHTRNVAISYPAIVPNLPPLIPPAVPSNFDPSRLAPLTDAVSQSSSFTGHGLGASFDVQFPIAPRTSIITGLSIGLIRGSANSQYVSRSSFYFDTQNPGVPLTKDELFAILSSGDEEAIGNVFQEVTVVGLIQEPISQFAQSLDIYFGLEVYLYKGLKLFGTLRDTYYANVGEYVVPQPAASPGATVKTNERTLLNAGYEGYVIGLSWRF